MSNTGPIDAERAVTFSIVELVRHAPFYAHIIQQLERIFVDGDKETDVPTMGVGKRRSELLIKLYVNRKFVRELIEGATSRSQGSLMVRGVLEHEVLHLVFRHLTLTFSDKIRGNVACDLVVNSCIPENRLPKIALRPEQYGFEPNKSAFWYYRHLLDNEEFQKQMRNGEFGIGGALQDIIDSHKSWEEAAKDPLMGEFAKDIIRKAKELCNGQNYGSVPSEVVQQIDGILKKKPYIIPWNRVLRIFCASASESALDWTMSRKSRRYGTRPGTKKEDVLSLAVAVDTSGSISDEQLGVFFSEVLWIWKNGASVTIIECDAEIATEPYPFRGKFPGKIHGRGGTDLEPPLKFAERRFDALIYFTDGYAPKINTRYRISTLFVYNSELPRDQFPYEWGQHIRISDSEIVPV